MKLLIHDVESEGFEGWLERLSPSWVVIGPGGMRGLGKPERRGATGSPGPAACVGCFGCWTKTPGDCVIRDGYGSLGRVYAAADRLVLLTRVTFGGYSPFVKRVLDRNIGYLLPFFTFRQGEMHHVARYRRRLDFTVAGYGGGEEERTTFQELAAANALNLNARECQVFFSETPAEVLSCEEVFG